MSETVLLATRLGDDAARTAIAAARLASRLGAELVLAYVADELETVPAIHAATGDSEESLRAGILAEVEAEIRAFLERVPEAARARVMIREGNVVEEILHAAEELGASYLVIGPQTSGAAAHLILGSTSDAILKRAPVPVLVVP
jgi:universal stress protein A